MKNKFTLVEDVLGVYSDRVWYYIPHYNGYEISNDGYIRSMKHYRKYPFGLLIEPKKNRKGEILQPIRYELSNDNNEREVLTLDEIKNLAYNNPRFNTMGYPRKTFSTDISSRNQRYFVRKKQDNVQPNKRLIYPKFTVIKEDSNPNIICPIESINGGIYYGRKNN